LSEATNWGQTAVGRLVRNSSARTGNELLINSGFDDQLTAWGTCNDNTAVTVTDSSATVTGENCIHQNIELSDYQDLNLSCDVRRLNAGHEWAGVSLSYYDPSWALVSEAEPAQITSETFSSYSTSSLVPDGARHALVLIYTTTGVSVSGCSLTTSSVVEPPEPEPEPDPEPEPEPEFR